MSVEHDYYTDRWAHISHVGRVWIGIALFLNIFIPVVVIAVVTVAALLDAIHVLDWLEDILIHQFPWMVFFVVEAILMIPPIILSILKAYLLRKLNTGHFGETEEKKEARETEERQEEFARSEWMVKWANRWWVSGLIIYFLLGFASITTDWIDKLEQVVRLYPGAVVLFILIAPPFLAVSWNLYLEQENRKIRHRRWLKAQAIKKHDDPPASSH